MVVVGDAVKIVGVVLAVVVAFGVGSVFGVEDGAVVEDRFASAMGVGLGASGGVTVEATRSGLGARL